VNTTLLKMKVVEELNLFPEESLPDLYRFVHDFRLGLLNSTRTNSTKTIAIPPSSINPSIEPLSTANAGPEEHAEKLQRMIMAAHDPLFLADLQETQSAFGQIDTEWWEPAV
jgi:hypothetical protein